MDATIFIRKNEIYLGYENIKKKTDLKSSILAAVWIFFLSEAPTAQNSPELNIRFIDSCIQ